MQKSSFLNLYVLKFWFLAGYSIIYYRQLKKVCVSTYNYYGFLFAGWKNNYNQCNGLVGVAFSKCNVYRCHWPDFNTLSIGKNICI